MLTLGSKKKVLYFDVVAEGVKKEDLEFWFRIRVDDRSHGFLGKLQENGKVRIEIPSMINELAIIDSGKTYDANLEVIGEEKYFVRTWEGKVCFDIIPKVQSKMDDTLDNINHPVITQIKTRIIGMNDIEDEDSYVPGLEDDDSQILMEPESEENLEEDIDEDNLTESSNKSLLEEVLSTSKKSKQKSKFSKTKVNRESSHKSILDQVLLENSTEKL